MIMQDPLALETSRLSALRRLDAIDPNEVVKWAAQRLAGGDDIAQLVDLASMGEARAVEVDDGLFRLLDATNTPAMDDLRAAMIVAKLIANDIVSGSVTPVAGARMLWWDVARRVPRIEHLLRDFIGLASEWDAFPERRADYDMDIVSAALRFLEEAPERP